MRRRIRLIKDTEKGIAGKEYEASEKSAESYVSNGYAVYIDEEEKTENKSSASIQVEVLQELLKAGKESSWDASEKIASKLQKENSFYCIRSDEKEELWIYHNGIYVPNGKSFIRETCRAILGRAYNRFFAETVVNKVCADNSTDPKEFFSASNINEVCVMNGVLDIFTRELKPFTQDKIFFQKLPVMFDPSKKCPAIETHLTTVLKGGLEDVKVFYELMGFILLKEYRYEKSFMFTGSGRNGKSKTLELIKCFVGEENCSSVGLQEFENDQFAKSNLLNKLVNIAGDLPAVALQNTGDFKGLTGRDIQSANRKFLPRVQFTNFAKMVFSCNELPRTADTSPAFWNRWILLEFPWTFISEKEFGLLGDTEKKKYRIADPQIVPKLTTPDELSGLLNEALEGLSRLQVQKDFSYSSSVAEVSALWMRKSDSFSAFFDGHLKEEWGARIPKNVLSKLYTDYCRAHKVKIQKASEIKTALESRGIWEDRRHTQDNFVREWVGVDIKSEGTGAGSAESAMVSNSYATRNYRNRIENSSTSGTLGTKGLQMNLSRGDEVQSPDGCFVCPYCNSTDTHSYTDAVQCFNCKRRVPLHGQGQAAK